MENSREERHGVRLVSPYCKDNLIICLNQSFIQTSIKMETGILVKICSSLKINKICFPSGDTNVQPIPISLKTDSQQKGKQPKSSNTNTQMDKIFKNKIFNTYVETTISTAFCQLIPLKILLCLSSPKQQHCCKLSICKKKKSTLQHTLCSTCYGNSVL